MTEWGVADKPVRTSPEAMSSRLTRERRRAAPPAGPRRPELPGRPLGAHCHGGDVRARPGHAPASGRLVPVRCQSLADVPLAVERAFERDQIQVTGDRFIAASIARAAATSFGRVWALRRSTRLRGPAPSAKCWEGAALVPQSARGVM